MRKWGHSFRHLLDVVIVTVDFERKMIKFIYSSSTFIVQRVVKQSDYCLQVTCVFTIMNGIQQK